MLCLASGGSSGRRGLYLWRWDAMSDYILGCLRRSLAQVAAVADSVGPVPFASVSAPAPIHTTHAIGALLSGDLLEVHRLSVDHEGRPVPPGTRSTRVLITNLVNHTQPLIRFVLDDAMVQAPPAADHGHLRVTVDGRSDESFSFGDAVLHPITVRSVMVHHPHVAEYRVHQTRNGLFVEVVEEQPIDRDALAAELRAALADAGVSRASVQLAVRPSISRHHQTGKVRRFVPLGAAV